MKFSLCPLAIASVAAVASFGQEARAQDTNLPYLIEQATDPWLDRFGTQVPFGFNFNDNEAAVTIPFAFNYFTSSYTSVNIGTNGFIAFGESALERLNQDLPDTGAPNNLIAPFWDDLYAGNINTSVEGTAPNRVFIVAFQSMQTLSFAEVFNYQIWLYETPPGRFEVHYGPSSFSSFGFVSASMGFENSGGHAAHTFDSCGAACNAMNFPSTDTVYRMTLELGDELYAANVQADVTGTPLRLYQGIPFDARTRVASYHQGDLGPFVYSLFLIGVNDTEPTTPPFFTSQEITLTEFESREVVDSVTPPLDVLPGRYRIAAMIDSANQITEPNENNNFVIGTQQFLVGERAPDLQASAVLPDATNLGPGTQLGVSFTLTNAGNLETTGDWRVVLSQNRAPSAVDLVLASSATPATLAIGESQNLTANVTIPQNIHPGRYYFGIVVDPTNTVSELLETNNNARSDSIYEIKTPTVDISTTSVPVAYVGGPYTTRLIAAGGDGNYVWTQTGGDLPAGMTFVGGPVGEIRGTPTEEGSASVTFKVSSNSTDASRTFMIEVHALGGPLTIVTRELLPGIVGLSYPPAEEGQDPANQQRLIAVGGAGPATFELRAGAPAGVTVDADGYVHGVPASRGVFMLSVNANDGATTVTRDIPLTIVEPGRLTLVVGGLPEATLGEPYSYSFFTVGQSPGQQLHFGIDASSIAPNGLSLGINDGVLAGTPSQAGTFVFTVRVVEGGAVDAPSDTASVTLRVVAPSGSLSITPSTVPDATIDEDYKVTFEARQGVGPFVWTTENAAGQYPAGLMGEVVEIDGVKKFRLSGVPTELPSEEAQGVNTGGVFSFLLKLDDAQGRHAEEAVSLRILPAVETMTPMMEDKGGCGCTAVGFGASSPLAASIAGAALLAFGLFSRRRR